MSKPVCEIFYNKKALAPHVRQIYTGFCELSKKQAIDVTFIEHDWNPDHKTENLVKVRVNGTTNIIYDTNDGLYWIHGNIEENLQYFSKVILPQCDYLFKRSYSPELASREVSDRIRIYPLGFNYDVTSPSNAMDDIGYSHRDKLRRIIKSNSLLSRLFNSEHKRVCYFTNYESYPTISSHYTQSKILFLTRLWDPKDSALELETSGTNTLIKDERKRINNTRIECVEACTKNYKDRFIGGLMDDEYARKIAPHLIAPKYLTKKSAFLKLIKISPICIATTGLHNSTGWKFAEYVAASRAIITERLNYLSPGQFEAEQNYLKFDSADELQRQIEFLSDNPPVMHSMMWNNYKYYNSYLRPDSLILNTLRTVLG